MVIRKRVTRREAIKMFCYECMGFQRVVRQCTASDCPLYPYRFGTEEKEAWPEIIEKFTKEGYFRLSDAGIKREPTGFIKRRNSGK